MDEFMNIVKKSADLCNENLYLSEDTRKMFSSFDFTPDDAVELRAVLKPVVEKIHGNAEITIQISMVYCKKIYYQKSLVVTLP